jgi:hypothetical protein
MVAVIPVSDPNAATMAQKVVQYQAALQLAQTAPQLYDLPVLHRQMLDVLGIKNYQKLVPMQDDMKPRDPVTENQNILKGKPVKAFLYQDHQAHITVHMAAAQDPHIQQLVGQNPQMANTIQAALSAHIAEHLGYEYRKQIEQTMQRALPTYTQPGQTDDDSEIGIPPEIEVQVSQLAAQAAQQLLAQHQQQAQQQQAQQQAQDPIVQMQQQEIQIKQAEQQRKATKDQQDFAIKQQQVEIERERIASHQETAGAQLAIKAASDLQKLHHQHESQGFQAGMELHKHRAQIDEQRANAFNEREHQAHLERMRQNVQQKLAETSAQQKPKPQKGE